MFDRWNFERWPVPLHQHESFYAFHVDPRLESGIHEIRDEGRRLHALFDNRKSRHLLVFFHGSMKPGSIGNLTLPVFSGFHLTEGLRADHLLLSDATLSLGSTDIQLGWYSGTSDYNFAQRLEQIIASVAGRKPYDNILFIGGSGGGFTALRAAAAFPGSGAIVWNPQTEIGRYHTGIVNDFARACFDVPDYQAIPLALRQDRLFDVKALWHRTRSRVIYFQNTPDAFHVERHALPFLASHTGKAVRQMPAPGVHQISDRLLLVSGNWKGKHAPPPRKFILRAIREMLRDKGEHGFEAIGAAFAHPDAEQPLFHGHVPETA